MVVSFLIRGLPLRIRPQHHRLAAVLLFGQLRRPAFTTAADESAYRSPSKEAGDELKVKDPPQLQIFDSPGDCAWKDIEKEILEDIEPITLLVKEILHSKRYDNSFRYMNGEHLTLEDEKALVDNLLSYHLDAEDKIGCGLDSIMVDRHPLFRQSRCLFVVGTDGQWTDFSYKKCLRQYIRSKYPSHAERFIQQHLKP